jgi:hypothetical protein
VPAGRRSTTSGSGTRSSQQLAGKRKDNELASSGDSMDPANGRPAPDAGSVPLPATSTVTGEQADTGSWLPGPSGGAATYAAVMAGPVVPSQPKGRSSPQPWIWTHPNHVLRQPIGACLGLSAACQMSPLQVPKWSTPS